MPTISVIVPVYKVEKYIHRCVDSILAQTYTDFELILVDDGSPDNCGAICDAYASKDSRVVVIHQENGGLSAARNAGIDWVFANSNSQWLTFVDSDDWVHPEMLQKLLEANLMNHTNISACAFCQTSGEDLKETHGSVCVHSPADAYLQSEVNMVVACAKLYRKQSFSNIRYPVGKIHEDEFTTYKLLFKEEKISVLTAPYYRYYINPEGITKSQWNPHRLHVIQAYEEQIAFFEKNGYPNIAKIILQTLTVNTLKQFRTVKRASYKKYWWPYLYKLYGMRVKATIQCVRKKAMDIWLLEEMYPRFVGWCIRNIWPFIRNLRN